MQHLSAPKSPARLAFICFLRTGRRISEGAFAPAPGPFETKFNPYHDATNGQFTFGPGGGVSGAISDGVYRPAENAPPLIPVAASPEPPRGIGSNSGAFLDPMTLDQAFPGLSNVPGGSIVAAGANILDLTGPGNDLTRQSSLDYTNALIGEIKEIDPKYRFETLGFPATFDGQMRLINDLRWDRRLQSIVPAAMRGHCKWRRIVIFRNGPMRNMTRHSF